MVWLWSNGFTWNGNPSEAGFSVIHPQYLQIEARIICLYGTFNIMARGWALFPLTID